MACIFDFFIEDIIFLLHLLAFTNDLVNITSLWRKVETFIWSSNDVAALYNITSICRAFFGSCFIHSSDLFLLLEIRITLLKGKIFTRYKISALVRNDYSITRYWKLTLFWVIVCGPSHGILMMWFSLVKLPYFVVQSWCNR